MAEIGRQCGGPPGAPTRLFASDLAKAISAADLPTLDIKAGGVTGWLDALRLAKVIAVPLEAVAWMDALFWAAVYRCDHDDPDSRRIGHQHTEDAQKAGPIQSEP